MRTIKYTASYEKLISRLPAMFAYVETDEQGITTLVKATEGQQGNYGKVVANMETPDFNNGEIYECKDGVKLILKRGCHSYRTVIDTYYKAISDKEWERNSSNIYLDPFLAFVERGIGLKYVGLSEENSDQEECGVRIKKKFPLAPDYIYLGEAQTMYDKIIKMKKQIKVFEKHINVCKEDRFYYLKLKKEFEMMNGEKLIGELGSLIDESDDIAQVYYENSNGTKWIPKLNFNVNLTTTIKDLGMVTPYIQEWVPGKRYYHGDVVYYVDKNGYGLAWECNIKDNTTDTFKYDEYERKYINGYYDEESELIFFENGEDDTPSFWKAQSLNWTKSGEPETITVKGTCNSHLPSFRRYDEYINSYDQSESPDSFKDWLWYYRKGTVNNIESVNDEFGNIGVLYGNDEQVRGVEPITNCGSNVLFDKDGYAFNLAIWGDILIEITPKNDKKTNIGEITFTYWLGAHLKAKKGFISEEESKKENGIWYSWDDDGNYKYYFSDLTIDTDSYYGVNKGVKYTETYIYYKTEDDEKDSIWNLAEDTEIFEQYVLGMFDKDSKVERVENYKTREKFEFDTSNNVYVYDINIGNQIKEVPYIRTNFEAEVDITHVDVEKVPLVRYDYYNGVNFQPSVNKDINIERGVTQAYEKFIKFSEIKTFEDLENYANGGFFIFSKEDINLG